MAEIAARPTVFAIPDGNSARLTGRGHLFETCGIPSAGLRLDQGRRQPTPLLHGEYRHVVAVDHHLEADVVGTGLAVLAHPLGDGLLVPHATSASIRRSLPGAVTTASSNP